MRMMRESLVRRLRDILLTPTVNNGMYQMTFISIEDFSVNMSIKGSKKA
jgi:hypothetical protein